MLSGITTDFSEGTVANFSTLKACKYRKIKADFCYRSTKIGVVLSGGIIDIQLFLCCYKAHFETKVTRVATPVLVAAPERSYQ